MTNQTLSSSSKIVLAVEAAAEASVALAIDGQILQRSSRVNKTQGEHLLVMIDELLEEANVKLEQVDGIAFGRGPGSFTGVRIATGVAQGLAYSINKPLASVSTLAAMAQQAFDEHGFEADEQPSVLVCLDARKQQVYTARFDGCLNQDGAFVAQRVSDEQVLDPPTLVASPGEILGVGSGFDAYPALQEQVSAVHLGGIPQARFIARFALISNTKFESPFLAKPVYIRDNVTHGS